MAISRAVLIAILYYATGKLGILTAIQPGLVTVVWPPSGIALAALLLWGPSVWPGIFFGSAVLNAHTFLLIGVPLPSALVMSIGIATGALLQALAGAFFIRRFTGTSHPFEKVVNVFRFAGIAGFCCFIGATFGATALELGGLITWKSYAANWSTWWLGDFVGLVIVAPALLILRKRVKVDFKPVHAPEAVGLFVGILILSFVLLHTDLLAEVKPLPYMYIPFLLWGTFRFGQTGTVLFTSMVSAIMIWGTLNHVGPFVSGTLIQSLVSVQLFIGFSAILGLSVGALVIEHQEAENQLRKSEESLKLALEAAEIGIWNRNLATGVVTWTESLQKIYGYGPGEFPGNMTFLSRIHPDDRPGIVEAINLAVETGCVYNGEYRVIRPDGSERWVLAKGRAMFDSATNKTVRIAGSALDITERKRADQALLATTEELKRSNRDLENFASIASHDLKEPLRMITSYMALLAHRYTDRLDAEATEYIHFATDGARRMKELIDGLLAFSKVGTKPSPFEIVDCSHVVDAVLFNLKVAIEESGASLVFGDLPKLPGDPAQLTQLFQNLLANAIKFHGQRPPEIRISSERRDEAWLFSVRDNGIGFDMGYATAVFDIFRRLNAKEKFPGSGIGLALCRRVVENHGGKIWVQSQPDAGSIFYFTLPIRETPRSSALPSPARRFG